MKIKNNIIQKLEGNKIQRQAKMVKEIVLASSQNILEDERIHGIAAVVGLNQGLKYNGSFKNGLYGSLATYGTLVAANGVMNIARNIELIKNA